MSKRRSTASSRENTSARRNGNRPRGGNARRKKVRYAVVGLGHIAQVAVLPAFAHAANSEVTALVSDDPAKLKALARKYKTVEGTFSYDEYEACLEQVDAVYIALPNHLHADYTIRAAKAGVHVLCEKPMAVTAAECRKMIAACRDHSVKLMIAYRLHFEEINLAAIDLIRRGKIGEPKFFNSSFSMTVRDGDIRTKKDMGGGSLYDIGVYCINAARYLFRAEPTEVTAVSVNSGLKKFAEIDESTGAVLNFGDGRVASFVTSFNAADVAEYRVVGTKGQIHVDPAYEYAEGLEYEIIIDGKSTKKRIGKRDQFAAELLYFSKCVLENRQPEPSGEEGMQDVRIVEALYESSRRGKAVAIPPLEGERYPARKQKIVRPGVKKPRLVKVQSASE
jgi:glucose-fructose oxidoreductase